MIDKSELYSKLTCALMHNLEVCEKCNKCGKDAGASRMNIIRALAQYMNEELPWEESPELTDKKLKEFEIML